MEDYLKEVDSEHYFLAANGMVIKSLEELAVGVEGMDNHTFKHHVNHQRNDFVNWIRDIIKDEILAKELSEIKEKHLTALVLMKRIKNIKKEIKIKKFFSSSVMEFFYGAVTGIIIGFVIALIIL